MKQPQPSESEYQLSEQTKRHIESMVSIAVSQIMISVMQQFQATAVACQKVMFEKIDRVDGDEWKDR